MDRRMIMVKRRIFIVEDHDVVRESYEMFLNMVDGLEVCETAASAEAALERIDEAAPDLVLVDISLPGMSGIEFIKRLQSNGTSVPALIITGHDNEFYRREAMRAGARGFVMKQDGPDALLEAVYEVLRDVRKS